MACVCTYACTCTYACVCMCMCVCVRVCVCARVHVHVCVCERVCVGAHVYLNNCKAMLMTDVEHVLSWCEFVAIADIHSTGPCRITLRYPMRCGARLRRAQVGPVEQTAAAGARTASHGPSGAIDIDAGCTGCPRSCVLIWLCVFFQINVPLFSFLRPLNVCFCVCVCGLRLCRPSTTRTLLTSREGSTRPHSEACRPLFSFTVGLNGACKPERRGACVRMHSPSVSVYMVRVLGHGVGIS
jgi:hypothetical protein